MRGRGKNAICAVLFTALAALGFAGSASAKLTGDYTVFQQCPRNTAAKRCLYAEINSGGFAIGEKGIAIVNPVTLQAGYNEGEEGALLPIFAAANGETLSKTPQPIPGGLVGLMPPKAAPPALKGLLQGFANSPLNRVSATLELAGPASTVKLSILAVAGEEGTAIEMPAKLHLENPLLGKNCYIGSGKTPILVELTVGTTSPPPPNLPIKGLGGTAEFLDEGSILRVTGTELVDNAWSMPKATGCGGVLSSLIDPLINKQMGLPSAAGRNTVILKATATITSTVALQRNEEENP
jgi:hypothetical protein